MNKYKAMRKLYKQRGVTIPEVLGAILIGIIITAAILVLISKAKNKAYEQQTIQAIQQISMGVDSLFSQSTTFDGLTTALTINAGIAPKNLISGTTIKTPWRILSGAESTIAVAPTTAKTQFTVTVDNIPSDSCQGIANSFLTSDTQMSINGTASTTSTAINTNCIATSPATIIFTFA